MQSLHGSYFNINISNFNYFLPNFTSETKFIFPNWDKCALNNKYKDIIIIKLLRDVYVGGDGGW